MDITFATGILGSIALVLGAAWSEKKAVKIQYKSLKNWFFAIGGLLMLIYSILGYIAGGAVFYVFLEALAVVASVLMMLNTDDRLDTVVISILGLVFIVWSLFLFKDFSTVLFILGLAGIGLGYAFENGTIRRDLALTLGSILVALFSYFEQSWIFFWVNVFFAIFSGYYLARHFTKRKK